MGTYKSTVSIGEADGIRFLNPNKVLYLDEKTVQYNEKKYKGFYISYNNHDTDIYGCDTTAVVLGQMQLFFILKGDHGKELVDAAENGGLDACLAYIEKHTSEMSEFSD